MCASKRSTAAIEDANGLSGGRKSKKFSQSVPAPTLNIATPSDIYAAILSEVEALFSRIAEARHESAQFTEANRQCHTLLNQIRVDVNRKISELEGNAEWKEFTIAFYGETNAGKSTIIEMLRIHLAEEKKIAEQNAFVATMAKAGLTRTAIVAAEQAVDAAGQQLSDFEANFAVRASRIKAELEGLELQLSSQRQTAADVKASAPFWKKLVFLFKEPQEALEARQLAERVELRKAAAESEFEVLKQQHQALKATKAGVEQVFAEMKRMLDHLAQLADGRIIGDGQSDFTKETCSYRFDTGHGKFVLLDVPGIEGKEQVVIEEVMRAVKKAHAVFYVTSKAAPPQRGEKDLGGTLEKIKAHLNDQTEVWTIFNKRITNPMQLKGAMVSEDELASLNTLDAVMRKQLGKNYAGTLTVAARPAFLSVAQCLVPFGTDELNKEKFAKSYDAQELIERSGLGEFTKVLGEQIIAGFPAKIRKANFNKATTVLTDAMLGIQDVRDKHIEPLIKDLIQTEEATSRQLQGALEELNADFIAEMDSQIEKFKSSVRRKIYREIDRDISNDAFKGALEVILEAELPELTARITGAAEGVFEKFKRSAQQALEQYKRHVTELQTVHARYDGTSLSSRFELSIKLDNGINIAGVVSTLVGGALLWWNPAGWLYMAAGVTTVLIGIYKGFRSLLSSEYKKQQQREAADKNIRNVGWEVESSASSAAREAIDKIKDQLQETEMSLRGPIETANFVGEAFADTVVSLATLSKAVKAQAAA